MKTPTLQGARKALGLQPAGAPLDGGLLEAQARANRAADAARVAANRAAMLDEAARVAVAPPPTGFVRLDGLEALATRLARTRAEASAAEERHVARLAAIDTKLEAAAGKAVRALVQGDEPAFGAESKLRAERAQSFATLHHEQDAVAVATAAINASITIALAKAVRGLWEEMRTAEDQDIRDLVTHVSAVVAVADRRRQRHQSALSEIGRVRQLLPDYRPAHHGTPDDRVVEAFLSDRRLGVEPLATTALAIRPESLLTEFLATARKRGYTDAV
jgi:hypothetical protein